jgi:hypothetical protein
MIYGFFQTLTTYNSPFILRFYFIFLLETSEVVWLQNIKQQELELAILDKFKQPHKSGIYMYGVH